MKPWKDDIAAALTVLGGRGSLADIYASLTHIRAPLSGHWRATVRGTLERNSSDSENYRGGDDLFYSVGGIGSGEWGLR